ncbi:histidine kinase [Helicobacter salomonis]|uniref:histidine kinase n=1 Tax=Helicobacter salomonis TaxID=56878 RepID=UPI000CF03856|nr:histidine kinase [Helicobacter salomonis]
MNNDPKKRSYTTQGYKAFLQKQYFRALFLCSQALFLDPLDANAKIGLLLSDIALDFPKEAHSFYELYQNLLHSQPRRYKASIQGQILELINSFDESLSKMAQAFGHENQLKAESLDGILYADFKAMCAGKDFKEVFENLMFSTKVIFERKEDFYEFLENLVDHKFYDMSIAYIENMRELLWYDPRVMALLQKALRLEKAQQDEHDC